MPRSLIMAAALSLIVASGSTYGSEIKPLVRMGMDFGGDKIVTLTYDNGDETELKGAQLFSFIGGILYQPANQNFGLLSQVSYKFDQANGANGTAKFTRIPIDVLALYVNQGHRVGAGFAYHLNPTFTCDVSGVCGANVDFANALGFVVQYEYAFNYGVERSVDIGVRYTSLEYKAENGATLDGSGAGFFFGMSF